MNLELNLEQVDKILEIKKPKGGTFIDSKKRVAFQISINDELYNVWDIPGYEHENGKWNGTPTTWWLEYNERLIPYVDIGVNRICWEINYKQTNSIKYKWDDADIRSGGRCTLRANGKDVYEFFSRNPEHALPKANSLLVQLIEHPFNFLNQEEEEGRKIWYYGLPATISIAARPGEMSIVPEYSADLPEDKWWELYLERSNPVQIGLSKDEIDEINESRERSLEWKDFGRIGHGDPLWDGMIQWFRK